MISEVNICTLDAQHAAAARAVDTDDPEIQIIESTTTKNKVNPAAEARFARKRALNPHITFKDHSKNPLFKSTLQDHMKSLAASGLALNQHQAIALRLRVSHSSVIFFAMIFFSIWLNMLFVD